MIKKGINEPINVHIFVFFFKIKDISTFARINLLNFAALSG